MRRLRPARLRTFMHRRHLLSRAISSILSQPIAAIQYYIQHTPMADGQSARLLKRHIAIFTSLGSYLLRRLATKVRDIFFDVFVVYCAHRRYWAIDMRWRSQDKIAIELTSRRQWYYFLWMPEGRGW